MAFVIRHARVSGPQNDRAVEPAKHRLGAITRLAQKELNNSLQVNSFPCYVYQRLTSGRICSCSIEVDNGLDSSLFDNEGNASQTTIMSLLTGNRFSIEDYGRAAPTGKSLDETSILPDISPIRFDNNLEEAAQLESDLLAVEIDPLRTTDFDISGDAYSNGSCPVCFGSGFVGGYSLFNGFRHVIDVHDPTLKLYGVSINQLATPPFTFVADSETAYFTFNYTLAKLGTVNFINVYNGADLVTNPVLVFDKTQNTYVTFTTANASTYQTGLPQEFRVNLSMDDVITHIEIQGMYGNLQLIDFPHLTREYNTEDLESIGEVNMIFGPTAYNVKPNDLVSDSVFGKLWRIMVDDLIQDASLRNMGYDARARLVQRYERLNQLPSAGSLNPQATIFNRHKYPSIGPTSQMNHVYTP